MARGVHPGGVERRGVYYEVVVVCVAVLAGVLGREEKVANKGLQGKYNLLFAYPGSWPGTLMGDIVAGGEMAVAEINGNASLLKGVELELIPVWTYCDQNLAYTKAMAAHTNRTLGYVGGSCSSSSRGLTFASLSHNAAQLSVFSTHEDLSDKGFYPLFSRSVASDVYTATVLYSVLEKLNYSRVAILHDLGGQQMDLFQNFVTLADGIDVDYIGSFVVDDDAGVDFYHDVLQDLYTHAPNVRAVVLFVSRDTTTTFLFEAACNASSFFSASDRALGDYVFLTTNQGMTTSVVGDLCPHGNLIYVDEAEYQDHIAGFEERWVDFRQDDAVYASDGSLLYHQQAPFAYDSVWAMALALDAVIAEGGDPYDGALVTQKLRALDIPDAASGPWRLDPDTGNRILAFDAYLRPTTTDPSGLTHEEASRILNFDEARAVRGDNSGDNLDDDSLSPIRYVDDARHLVDALPPNSWPPSEPSVISTTANGNHTWFWYGQDLHGDALLNTYLRKAVGPDATVVTLNPPSVDSFTCPVAQSQSNPLGGGVTSAELAGEPGTAYQYAACVSVQLETEGGKTDWTAPACGSCKAGWALDEAFAGGPACRPCPGGTSEQDGVCRPCSRGTFSLKAATTECEYCSVGSYQPLEGQTSCHDCPANTIRSLINLPNPSPNDFIKYNELTDCVCLEGFYPIEPNRTGVECRACPQGASCAGGTAQPIPLKDWWGRPDTKHPVFYECDPRRCKGNFECENGFSGRLCSNAVVRETYLVGEIKKECPSTATKRWLLTGMYAVGLFAAWTCVNYVICSEYVVLDAAFRLLQMIAIVFETVEVAWPEAFDIYPQLPLQFLLFDVDLITMNCVHPYRERDKLISQYLLLGAFVIWYALPLVEILARFAISGRPRGRGVVERQGASVVGRASSLTDRGSAGSVPDDVSVASDDFSRSENDKAVGDAFSTAIARIVNMVWIQHPTLTLTALNMIPCRRVKPDGYVVNADPGLECYSTEHLHLLILAYLTIAGVSFGCPLALMLWLKRISYREQGLHRPAVIARFGNFYEGFIRHHTWMGWCLMQRVTWITIVGVLIQNTPLKIMLSIVIVVVSLCTHIRTQPYKRFREAYVEYALLWTALVVLFSAWMVREDDVEAAVNSVFVVFSSALILVFVLFLDEVWATRNRDWCAAWLRTFAINSAKAHTAQLDGDDARVVVHADSFRRSAFAMARRRVAASRQHRKDVDMMTELTRSFAPATTRSLLRSIQHGDSAEGRSWSLNTVARELQPFICDSAPTSYFSKDSRSSFWRTLADSFPGLIDFLADASRIDHEHRAVLFGCLVALQRHTSTEVVNSKLLHYMTQREDRGAITYALCSAGPEEWTALSAFLSELRAAGQRSTAFTGHWLAESGTTTDFFRRLERVRTDGGTGLRSPTVGSRVATPRLDAIEDHAIHRMGRVQGRIMSAHNVCDFDCAAGLADGGPIRSDSNSNHRGRITEGSSRPPSIARSEAYDTRLERRSNRQSRTANSDILDMREHLADQHAAAAIDELQLRFHANMATLVENDETSPHRLESGRAGTACFGNGNYDNTNCGGFFGPSLFTGRDDDVRADNTDTAAGV